MRLTGDQYIRHKDTGKSHKKSQGKNNRRNLNRVGF